MYKYVYVYLYIYIYIYIIIINKYHHFRYIVTPSCWQFWGIPVYISCCLRLLDIHLAKTQWDRQHLQFCWPQPSPHIPICPLQAVPIARGRTLAAVAKTADLAAGHLTKPVELEGVSHDGPKQQPLYLSILLDWLHWTSLNSASHTDSFTSQLWIVKPQRMLLMSNSVPVFHLPPKASRSCCLSHTKPPRHAAKTPQEKCRDCQHRLGKAIVPSYTRWAKISGRVSPSSPQLWSLLEAETACCGGQRAYPFEGDIPSGCLNSTAIKPPIP